MNLEFSRQIFEKHSNMELSEKLYSGSEVGQTDGHDEANSRFSQFCERA
jgi:hypothetical protein